MIVPPAGQIARFVRELLPTLPGALRCLLRVTATAPIGITGLRGTYNERGDFLITTTPTRNEGVIDAGGEQGTVFSGSTLEQIQ